MTTTVDIKAIQWIEGTESAAAWFVFRRLCDWFDEFGWNARADAIADYDASADLGSGRFAFRIAKVVVVVDVEWGADATEDRVTRAEVVRA